MRIVLQFIAICLPTVALSTSWLTQWNCPEKCAWTETRTWRRSRFTTPIGGLGEPLAMVTVLVLVVITPKDDAVFWWTTVAFGALTVMHGVYWAMTHPMNKFWLKGQDLNGLGKGFCSIGSARPDNKEAEDPDLLWRRCRDRWEHSHVFRAIFATIAFISLLITLAAHSPN
jgi:hypothetical protein